MIIVHEMVILIDKDGFLVVDEDTYSHVKFTLYRFTLMILIIHVIVWKWLCKIVESFQYCQQH